MTVGRLWKSDRQNGPVAHGYLTVFGVDVKIALWRNQKRGPKDPDLTISVDNPAKDKLKEEKKEFVDDIPF